MAEYAPLAQRAHGVGIFRFWRDSGYAIGALLTGVLADASGLEAALVVQGRMFCRPVPGAGGSSGPELFASCPLAS